MANYFREYFNFSKKERIGIVVLLMLIAFVWLLPSFITYNTNSYTKEANAFQQEVAAYKASQAAASKGNDDADNTEAQHVASTARANKPGSLFYFDPNTLSQAAWQQLGLPDRTINTIQNYISKGGRFYKPKDLEKIFGLTKEDYTRLLPYVRIEKEAKEFSERREPQRVNTNQQLNRKKYELIDVNAADTTAFIELRGIGSKLAARIVNFRDRLGGFYAVEQIAEVYGIHDTVFQKIKSHLICANPNVRKLDINTASLDMLKAHPYIKYQVANAVIQYRKQHGNFKSVEQLKEIHILSQETFEKMQPYITIH